ncbi:hypothetical protein BJ322DRAFT_1034851 [Thelephora terrestris]|uniref:Uncharacterized protein n=1 Tax=Thelephora terrestris TaxID=56493 RepID=A0A9P6HRM4_9AGAM|nr:hypothetical protein BJ322DRAFT_1034851 [Thelephora terrestris]
MYPRLSILRPRHHATLHHRPPAIGSNPCFSLTLESCSMVLPHCLHTRRVNGCPWCAMALSTAKLTRGRTPEIGRVWKVEVWIVRIRRTSDAQKRPVALRSPRTSSIMLRIRFIVTCVLRLFSHCPWWIRSSRMLGPIRCIVAGVCSGEKKYVWRPVIIRISIGIVIKSTSVCQCGVYILQVECIPLSSTQLDPREPQLLRPHASQ